MEVLQVNDVDAVIEEHGELIYGQKTDGEELWDEPVMRYNPKNIDPKLLQEARDKEYRKLCEFGAFKWVPKQDATDG